jgi:hypothetical protein
MIGLRHHTEQDYEDKKAEKPQKKDEEDPEGNRESQLEQTKEHKVKFDCDFECGNIDQIRKKSNNEYHLFMRNDSNATNNL